MLLFSLTTNMAAVTSRANQQYVYKMFTSNARRFILVKEWILLAYIFENHMILPRWTKAKVISYLFAIYFTSDSADVTYGLLLSHAQIVDLEARTQFINQLKLFAR